LGSNATTLGSKTATSGSNPPTDRPITSIRGSSTKTGGPTLKEEVGHTIKCVGRPAPKKKASEKKQPIIPKKLSYEKTDAELDASVKSDVDSFFKKLKAESESK